MILDALSLITKSYAGYNLVGSAAPYSGCWDRSTGLLSGWMESYPESKFMTCWPHIIRKVKRGEYMSRTDANFEAFEKDVQDSACQQERPRMLKCLPIEMHVFLCIRTLCAMHTQVYIRIPLYTHANMHARKHTIAATSAQILHRAKTEEQGQLLLEAVALTDAWKDGCVEGVGKFWNSYCVGRARERLVQMGHVRE